MTRNIDNSAGLRPLGWGTVLCLALVGGLSHRSPAAPPADPLPAPFYSFDQDSPKVLSDFVGAADILVLDPVDSIPEEAVPGEFLGLADASDALDALSSDNVNLASGDDFVLLFSVQRGTVGVALPDPILVARQVPYNATDQAAKSQQAGDQYMSTVTCRLGGGCVLLPRGLTPNNTLTRNNYDEGGTDFGADPPVGASESARRVAQDNVNSTALLPVSGPGGDVLNVYFSAWVDSPSLLGLSGSMDVNPSGAHVFFNGHPDVTANTELFASADQLGLQDPDDVDALIVIDANADHRFNPGDMVLFSLTPTSPSLGLWGGASAADVFRAIPGAFPGDPGVVDVFVSAAELGLDEANDDIDALEYTLCGLPETCAVAYAIRRLKGDFDDDGNIDMDDFVTFAACFTGPGGTATEGCVPGDFDGDGDIDCDDWTEFVGAWTEPGPPPLLSYCASAIPAASEWGLVIMILTGMVVGTVMFRRGL